MLVCKDADGNLIRLDAKDISLKPGDKLDVLLEGDGIRTQGGVEHPVRAGDCWLTPPGVDHSFTAGPRGARVLDVFSPPRAAYLQDA